MHWRLLQISLIRLINAKTQPDGQCVSMLYWWITFGGCIHAGCNSSLRFTFSISHHCLTWIGINPSPVFSEPLYLFLNAVCISMSVCSICSMSAVCVAGPCLWLIIFQRLITLGAWFSFPWIKAEAQQWGVVNTVIDCHAGTMVIKHTTYLSYLFWFFHNGVSLWPHCFGNHILYIFHIPWKVVNASQT